MQSIINNCDSIVTLDLTINYTSSSIQSEISCDSYLWNGNLYTNSGFYLDTLQSINGCDSIVTLSLIIKEATVDTIFANSCDFSLGGVIFTTNQEFIEIPYNRF